MLSLFHFYGLRVKLGWRQTSPDERSPDVDLHREESFTPSPPIKNLDSRLKQTLYSKGWELSYPYNCIGSLPESLTQGLLIGKLLIGGLGVGIIQRASTRPGARARGSAEKGTAGQGTILTGDLPGAVRHEIFSLEGSLVRVVSVRVVKSPYTLSIPRSNKSGFPLVRRNSHGILACSLAAQSVLANSELEISEQGSRIPEPRRVSTSKCS